MRNPPRTQQNSIFEPLFSQEQEPPTPPTHLIHSSSSEWLSSTHSASSCVDKTFCNNQLRQAAPATIFKEGRMIDDHECKCGAASPCECKEKCEPLLCGDGKPSSSHASTRSIQFTAPPSRSLSSSNVGDDGSVASKLLASITKSISSPSLLSCCKESARETPYQKTLRLRMLKLHHCAEELGSESSDGASIYNDSGDNSSFDSPLSMSLFNSSPRSPILSSFARSSLSPLIPHEDQSRSEDDASPMMISVRSAPNLRCSSLVSRHSSHMRERSFPPPLTHTLPRSASSDSFTFSLRVHREEGRFMLKEVKVPCCQYLQANRKDGRLTLRLFTLDEDIEQEDSTHKEFEDVADLRQGENVVDMCEGVRSVASAHNNEGVGCSCDEKLGVEESANTVVGGDLIEVTEVMKSKENDVVNMDEIEGKISNRLATFHVGKDGGLSAKSSLLRATINVNSGSKADHFDALCTRRPDLNGTKCKPESRPSATISLPSLSSSWNLNTHPSKNSPRLKVSPVTRFSQCEENLVLLNRKPSDREVKSMLGLKISSASLQATGFGIDRSLTSTIIFKDMGANSLMENVTKLVNSFGLDGGKWCQAKVSSREQERSGFKDSQLKESSMYSGIRSINIGVSKVDRNGAQKASGGHILDVECERKLRHTDASDDDGDWINTNAGGLSTKSTTLQFDVQLPLHLDWLHSQHCKELFGRNQFANKLGFPCVAIRS